MRRNKSIILIVFLFLFLSASIYGFYLYSNVKKWNDKIYPRTLVNGIDVSGKTLEEAGRTLRTYYDYINNKKVIIRDKEKKYSIEYASLKVRYDMEEILNKAFQNKKDGNFTSKLESLKGSMENRYDLKLTYDTQPLKEFLDTVEKEINSQPKNAEVRISEKGAIEITNHSNGLVLDRETMEKAIASSINNDKAETVELEALVKETAPTVTTEKLSVINALISSFDTYYGSSSAGRAYNVELAVKKLGNILIMPGETFSFNKSVGARTPETGFKTAPVIVDNKLVDGLGGGVCQVSSTLYNSVIRCGIKSVARTNHTLLSAYVPPGFDATVSDDIDYKFKNTFEYPIVIRGYTKNRSVFFDIYSNSSLNKKKYDLVNEVYEKTDAETKYVEEPSLPKGSTEKVQAPVQGCKVKVYLVGSENGKEVSRELISNDTYTKVDGLIKVGTKKS